jgi:hypothetical protein
MNEQYIGGFLAKCAELGVDAEKASALLKMSASDGALYSVDDTGSSDYEEKKRRRRNAKLIMGIGGGALMGGSLAHTGTAMQNMLADMGARGARKVRLKEALLRILASAGIGAVTGGLAAHMDNKYRDYLGIDPLAYGVMTVDRR